MRGGAPGISRAGELAGRRLGSGTAGWRAQAGHGAVRGRHGLDGSGRAAGPRGVAGDHGALLRIALRRRPAVRGNRRQFTGDGIMALFGAPIAHEDHAPRACFAALHLGEAVAEYADELRRAKGLNFSVGSASTPARSSPGLSAKTGKMEYTAVGHTVGLAQRMEALAEPGKAYLTEHTASSLRDTSSSRTSASSTSREPADPIEVFELIGSGLGSLRDSTSPGSAGSRRFVGRSEEMGTLEEALEQAARAGEGSDRHRRRAGCRQEPALPRVHRALPGARDRRLSSAGQAHGEADPVPAVPADDARVLRDRRPRLRPDARARR